MNGKIGVTTENIFPVIKQFLYSDHEIFLRELVANAVDATQKLKALASNGDFKGELGDLKVEIELDEKEKVLKVIDRGIGMTEEEVDKYINQIAFSSAGEFLEKYKDQMASIIGHFGLGFYSAFMVSKKVTIDTLSWQEGAEAVRWSCDGSPEYVMEPSDKTDRGTVITLYLDDDSSEYAGKARIKALLEKYCKFMPVPVVFGKEQEWKDGAYHDTDKDQIINNMGEDPLILLNESFATTTEKEGSEIAYGIVRALKEEGVRIFSVTHLLSFAQRIYEESKTDEKVCFLCAEHLDDGKRTYKMIDHAPELTSFGLELYDEVLGSA